MSDKIQVGRLAWKTAFYKIAYGGIETSLDWLFANEYYSLAADKGLIGCYPRNASIMFKHCLNRQGIITGRFKGGVKCPEER